MENMYTGKSSRNPNMPMIWGLLMGLAFIAGGIYLYFDLADWEQSDTEKRMNAILWFVYDLGGKLAVAGIAIAMGVFFIWNGIVSSIKLRTLKKEGKQRTTY